MYESQDPMMDPRMQSSQNPGNTRGRQAVMRVDGKYVGRPQPPNQPMASTATPQPQPRTEAKPLGLGERIMSLFKSPEMPPPPPAPHNTQRDTLLSAQLDALHNPSFQPHSVKNGDKDNDTFCNMAVQAIARETGITGTNNGVLAGQANDIAARLRKGTPNSRQVNQNEVRALANKGLFVVGVLPSVDPKGHGHVVVAHPDQLENNPGSETDPLVNNIGRSMGVMLASTAFGRRAGKVTWYVISPESPQRP